MPCSVQEGVPRVPTEPLTENLLFCTRGNKGEVPSVEPRGVEVEEGAGLRRRVELVEAYGARGEALCLEGKKKLRSFHQLKVTSWRLWCTICLLKSCRVAKWACIGQPTAFDVLCRQLTDTRRLIKPRVKSATLWVPARHGLSQFGLR